MTTPAFKLKGAVLLFYTGNVQTTWPPQTDVKIAYPVGYSIQQFSYGHIKIAITLKLNQTCSAFISNFLLSDLFSSPNNTVPSQSIFHLVSFVKELVWLCQILIIPTPESSHLIFNYQWYKLLSQQQYTVATFKILIFQLRMIVLVAARKVKSLLLLLLGLLRRCFCCLRKRRISETHLPIAISTGDGGLASLPTKVGSLFFFFTVSCP